MKKILIVEDEMEIRNILKLYLLKEGYDVTEAEDGEVAIKLFYEKPFDLVILDIMLPKKDGWSVLREIKKYSSVPVMILSARDDDEDELFGFEIGTDETLFEGLYISENQKLCEEYMGKYPVIFLSMKDVDGLTYDEAENALIQLIGRSCEAFYRQG